MRRPRSKATALLLALGVAVLSASVAVAQEDEGFDLPGVMAEFFASEAGQELAAEYTVDPSQSGAMDPTGDFEFSTGEDPQLPPTGDLDITGSRTFVFNPPPFGQPEGTPFWAPEADGGIFCEADPLNPVIPGVRTLCPQTGVNPAAFEEGAVVSVIDTAEPFGFFNLSLQCEWVMWYRAVGAAGVFTALPDFPLDPADGTNQAIGLRTGSDDFGPFTLHLSPDGFFEPMPTDTLIAIGENQIAFFTPLSEIGMPEAARAYTFCTEGGFQAADSVADSTDLVEVELVQLELVSVVPIEVEPSTTTTTATSTTTTTLATAEDEGEETGDIGNLESGSFSQFVTIAVIVVGGIAVVVGFWIYYRTRERGRPETETPGVSTDDGEGGDDPRDTGPPVVYGEEIDHTQCDWALYVSDGGNRKLLRPADGHECCVYDIVISTVVDDHDEAARGRQDAESSHVADASPDERTRIPDVGFGQGGGGLWGWASARSGPAGRLDWMQGLGDPRENAGRVTDHSPLVQVEQTRTLEEGPELAAYLTHLETTVITATLEAECPGHTNTYTLDGTSQANVQASYECTNRSPGPECPIEFTASGWIDAYVAGDLTYAASQEVGSDVDEIEPLAERVRRRMEAAGPVTMTDSHDHATRARDTFEDLQTGNGANVVLKDALTITMASGLVLDAGTIVPVATWPTTERVTADIYADLNHDITVDAKMERGDCAATACGGHGDCLCAPEFNLVVRGNDARLTVEGITYRLVRPAPDGTWALA